MVWLVIQVKKVAFLGGLDRVILEELYEIVNNRKNSEEEGSYTKYLLENSPKENADLVLLLRDSDKNN